MPDRTPAPPTPAATVEQTIDGIARLIWRANRDNPERDSLTGTEEALWAMRSFRERYQRAARAVLRWAAAHPAEVAAAAQATEGEGR